jgi:hypothetical protein
MCGCVGFGRSGGRSDATTVHGASLTNSLLMPFIYHARYGFVRSSNYPSCSTDRMLPARSLNQAMSGP